MNELRNSHLGNNGISILASVIFTDLISSVWYPLYKNHKIETDRTWPKINQKSVFKELKVKYWETESSKRSNIELGDPKWTALKFKSGRSHWFELDGVSNINRTTKKVKTEQSSNRIHGPSTFRTVYFQNHPLQNRSLLWIWTVHFGPNSNKTKLDTYENSVVRICVILNECRL